MALRTPLPSSPRAQRGAVLYVALIMLILLALIGIAGMQVTGMQERMAANYLRTNQAFQNAEADARQVEGAIESALDGGGVYAASQEVCSPTYDPLTWADAISTSKASYTRQIDKCSTGGGGGPVTNGKKKNEETNNIYQVTALASDSDTNASASAVIDTVFIP